MSRSLYFYFLFAPARPPTASTGCWTQQHPLGRGKRRKKHWKRERGIERERKEGERKRDEKKEEENEEK